MSDPHILYVDEISTDQIKAVVSDVRTVWANLGVIYSAFGTAQTVREFGERISGVRVMALGRYVCLLSRSAVKGRERGTLGMVLLDLTDRVDVGYKIVEQLNNKELEDRFMDVMTEIVWHPERHATFKLVVGKPPYQKRSIF